MRHIKKISMTFAALMIISSFVFTYKAYAEQIVNESIQGRITWVKNRDISSEMLNSIAFDGKGTYAAVGEDGVVLASQDGINWATQNTGVLDTLIKIVYGNSMFVAVGQNGTMITSPDGQVWDKCDLNIKSHFTDILYAENTFVAITGDGILLTSIDGKEWYRQISESNTGFSKIGYGNDHFVVVGNSAILTSDDGVTWQYIDWLKGTNLQNVLCENNLFVAVGDEGKIMTSENGISWTYKNSQTYSDLTNIVYGNNTYVATGSNGTVITSNDGINWIRKTIGTSIDWRKTIFSKNIFISINSKGDIYTSPNGIDWTLRHSGTYESINELIHTGDSYIAVGYNRMILTSKDSYNWSSLYYRTGFGINKVIYAKDTYIAVGDKGKVMTSKDGLAWEIHNTGTNDNLKDIVYANNTLTAIGPNRTVISSDDGINWRNASAGIDSALLYSISYGNNMYVITGLYGTIFTSEDGLTWTKIETNGAYMLNSAVFANGMFMAVGNGGIILTSADGSKWSAKTLNKDTDFRCVKYLNNRFIALSPDGIFATSTDGIKWTFCDVGMDYCYDVSYGNGKYVIVGERDSISSSVDGLTWKKKSVKTGDYLRAAEFENGIFAAVGQGGNTLTSSDGDNWTLETEATHNHLFALSVANHKFFALGVSTVMTGAMDYIPDTISPEFLSSEPEPNSENFPVGKSIYLYYSEPITTGSNFSSIAVTAADKNVQYSMSIKNNILIIDPAKNLLPNTKYSIIVPEGALADFSGNQISDSSSIDFTTAKYSDTILPNIKTTLPKNGIKDISENTQYVYIHFSENISEGVNFDEIALNCDDMIISCEKSVAADTLIIHFPARLDTGKTFTIKVPKDSITDMAGNNMKSEYIYKFTTNADPKVDKLSIGEENVKINSKISIYFSENIRRGYWYEDESEYEHDKIENTLIMLKDEEDNDIPVNITAKGKILTIEPNKYLNPERKYILTISKSAVRDTLGIPMKETFNFSFTTEKKTYPVEINKVFTSNSAKYVFVNNSLFVYFNQDVEFGNPIDEISLYNLKAKNPEERQLNYIYDYYFDPSQKNILIIETYDLSHDTTYTLTIPERTAAKLGDPDSFNKKYSFSFTTPSENPVLDIKSTKPSRNATNVSTTGKFQVTFNREFIPAEYPLDEIQMYYYNGEEEIPVDPEDIMCSIKNNLLEIWTIKPLKYNTTYMVDISEYIAVDLAGNKMKYGHIFTFTTEKDKYAPYLTGSIPNSYSTDITEDTPIQLIFNESIKLTSLKDIQIVDQYNKKLLLTNDRVWVDGENNNILVLDLKDLICKNTRYTIKINPGVVSDLSGNKSKSPYSIVFITDK